MRGRGAQMGSLVGRTAKPDGHRAIMACPQTALDREARGARMGLTVLATSPSQGKRTTNRMLFRRGRGRYRCSALILKAQNPAENSRISVRNRVTSWKIWKTCFGSHLPRFTAFFEPFCDEAGGAARRIKSPMLYRTELRLRQCHSKGSGPPSPPRAGQCVPRLASHRSASRAAMQPVPAAVQAWR
jgi:hypothetical protein